MQLIPTVVSLEKIKIIESLNGLYL